MSEFATVAPALASVEPSHHPWSSCYAPSSSFHQLMSSLELSCDKPPLDFRACAMPRTQAAPRQLLKVAFAGSEAVNAPFLYLTISVSV